MDCGRKVKNRRQRCGYHNSREETEYSVADDQEDLHGVHIQPSRPMMCDEEYADRDLPRSSSAPSLSSYPSGNSSSLPSCPPREIPSTSGPPINRELKPGRRGPKLDDTASAVQPRDQLSQGCSDLLPIEVAMLALNELFFSRPPPSTTQKPKTQFSTLSVQKLCRRDGQRVNKKAELISHSKGFEDASSSLTNEGHGLDTKYHVCQRVEQDLEGTSSTNLQHHLCPQTEEDIVQQEFASVQKAQQTCYDQDWYVGTCDRADAEHALHLVNQDGAFLVRDCSNITNSEPLVLAVYHNKKVYNVKIRFLESASRYALGTGQLSNDMFDSVADIISFHSLFPITLIGWRSAMAGQQSPDNCVLTCPVTKKDVEQLLK
ncbi:uncharacterized protein clnk isoform X1 [Genypterus blacodes]|uniref:uncharacterized protein clnk isoform X1 n=1 Tax=Genypterus blacodes TaxID=154954 RepID=UPI003F75FFA1